MIKLGELNELDASSAGVIFATCCGAANWVGGMVAQRPYDSVDNLLASAEKIWLGLAQSDWLEAFGAHPEIGTKGSPADKFGPSEQSGALGAPEQLLAKLARGNRAYRERFGYIFIVFATGKSGTEMWALLEDRLRNEPDIELRIAASEQNKITLLRLSQMIQAD